MSAKSPLVTSGNCGESLTQEKKKIHARVGIFSTVPYTTDAAGIFTVPFF